MEATRNDERSLLELLPERRHLASQLGDFLSQRRQLCLEPRHAVVSDGSGRAVVRRARDDRQA